MKKNKWSLVCGVIIAVMCLYPLSGAFEIKSVELVAGIAIDYDEKNNLYNLTFELFVPDIEGGYGGKSAYIESSGDTISKAIAKAKDENLKELFLDSVGILIIDFGTSQKGRKQLAEYFAADNTANIQCVVAQVYGSTAAAAIKGNKEQGESTRSLDYLRRLSSLERSGKTLCPNIIEFLGGDMPPLISEHGIITKAEVL